VARVGEIGRGLGSSGPAARHTAGEGAAPLADRPVGQPPYTTRLLRWSFTLALLPPALLIVALATRSLFLLTYAHVITGGTWTGFDVFMGLVMSRILGSLEIPQRVEVAKRLTPTTFFVLPSLAAVAVTSGIYLALAEGKFDLTSPWIFAAGAIVVVLTVQGFGIFMPNGLRILIELGKHQPDFAKIARLNMRTIRLAGVQAVLQVLLIVVMSHLAVY
jgi:hypothetical protein